MKRVLSFEQGKVNPLNAVKYVFQDGNETVALYQRMTPTGYMVHQDWLLVLGDKYLVCESYNNKCKEEMLDLLDEFCENGCICVKGFDRIGMLPYIHPNGNKFIIRRY